MAHKLKIATKLTSQTKKPISYEHMKYYNKETNDYNNYKPKGWGEHSLLETRACYILCSWLFVLFCACAIKITLYKIILQQKGHTKMQIRKKLDN